jgi:hypothetical protein
MQALDGSIHFSASDLLGHINCRYLTNLDLKVVKGILVKPTIRDPGLDVLIERGRRRMSAFGTKPTSTGNGEVSASRGKADMTRTGCHFRV